MIKTVSFAPPRSSRASGSGSPATARSNSKRRPSRASSTGELNLFDSPFVSPATSEPETTTSIVEVPLPRRAKPCAKVEVEVVPEGVPEVETPSQAKAPKKPRVKRAIVPENLAEQYGAKQSRRAESAPVEVEIETPKKRLTKTEREARNQLLRVDEGLLQRLARAAAIVPSKKAPRPRGWRFECGRCGAVSHFEASIELCVCGAIAVKE